MSNIDRRIDPGAILQRHGYDIGPDEHRLPLTICIDVGLVVETVLGVEPPGTYDTTDIDHMRRQGIMIRPTGFGQAVICFVEIEFDKS